MEQIKWESDLQAALALAAGSQKPIFVDFWFDG